MEMTMSLTNVISSPNISWQGRWSRPTDSKPITAAWGASVLLLKTDAPRVVLRTGSRTRGYNFNSRRFGNLNVPCVIFYRAGDGPIHKEIVRGQQDVELVSAAPADGPQIVELVMGELGGHLELSELLITEGHELVSIFAPSPPPLDLLVIGASQTTGTNTPDIHPPPLPFGAVTGWPLVLTRQLRAEGKPIRTTVVARPGIRLVEGEWEGEILPGMDKRFWEGWDGDGAFGPRMGEEERADVIFISIGSNDKATGVSADEFLAGLKTFIETLLIRLPRGVKHIVFVAPFGFHSLRPDGGWARTGVWEREIEQTLADLGKEWAEKGREEKVWFCGTKGWVDGSRCPDMLHPDEQGNVIIAQRVREWCTEHLGDLF